MYILGCMYIYFLQYINRYLYASTFRPTCIVGTHCLSVGRDFYCVTPPATQDLGFGSLTYRSNEDLSCPLPLNNISS